MAQTSKTPEDARLPLLLPVQYTVAVSTQGDPKITAALATGGAPDPNVGGVVAGAQQTILGFFSVMGFDRAHKLVFAIRRR